MNVLPRQQDECRRQPGVRKQQARQTKDDRLRSYAPYPCLTGTRVSETSVIDLLQAASCCRLTSASKKAKRKARPKIWPLALPIPRRRRTSCERSRIGCIASASARFGIKPGEDGKRVWRKGALGGSNKQADGEAGCGRTDFPHRVLLTFGPWDVDQCRLPALLAARSMRPCGEGLK
jgi:hypothetical protein